MPNMDLPFPDLELPVSFIRRAKKLLSECRYSDDFGEGIYLTLAALGYNCEDNLCVCEILRNLRAEMCDYE